MTSSNNAAIIIIMKTFINSVFKTISNIIAPPFCVSCEQFLNKDHFLCFNCGGKIIPVATKNLAITPKYTAKIFAVSDYQEPLKSLVMAKHYGNRLASRQLGQLIWELTDIKYADFDIIVPVPLHWSRKAWRWFNQAEVIADILSSYSKKPVAHLLKRKRYTSYQTSLTRVKRLTNLEDAFELVPGATEYKNKKILLVDDVMTTGTTLRSCAKVLVAMQPDYAPIIAVACRNL